MLIKHKISVINKNLFLFVITKKIQQKSTILSLVYQRGEPTQGRKHCSKKNQNLAWFIRRAVSTVI